MFSFFGRKVQLLKSQYEAAERDTREMVKRGQRQYPSWINDPSWQKTLAQSTFDEVIKKAISKDDAKIWFSQQETADTIMTMVAQLEKAKLNRFDQISGAMEFAGKLALEQIKRERV